MKVWWLAAIGFSLLSAGSVLALPPGAPCAERYNRYQAVVEADHRTGNVEPPVYAAIERELARAAAACDAGRDGEALSLIRQSEARHGYHP